MQSFGKHALQWVFKLLHLALKTEGEEHCFYMAGANRLASCMDQIISTLGIEYTVILPSSNFIYTLPLLRLIDFFLFLSFLIFPLLRSLRWFSPS